MKRLFLVLFATSGCSLLANVEVGYAYAVAKSPEQAAVALNGNLGFGAGNVGGAGAGAGVMLRTKIGPNVQQVAWGPMAYAGSSLGADSKIAFAAIGGFHLLQFENVHTAIDGDTFGFGMFSPVAEALMFIRPARMSLGVAAEYDVRFTSVHNTGYVSFLIGYGAFGAGGTGGGLRY